MILICFLCDEINDGLVATIHKIFAKVKLKLSIIELTKFGVQNAQKINEYIVELQKSSTQAVVFLINSNDLAQQFPPNISFDIIISSNTINTKADDIIKDRKIYVRQIYKKIKEDGVLIINADDENLSDTIRGIKTHIVTYGFNPKSSITASSIGDNFSDSYYIFCLQRSIVNICNVRIEPHEFSVRIPKYSRKDVYNALAICAFALVCGVRFDYITNLLNET